MIQIAIDGPAGSGKSTTAKKIAEILNINYMDTGAMYRAFAYAMIEKGIDLADKDAIIAQIPKTNLEVEYEGKDQHVIINGKDVTHLIRTPEVSAGASAVGTIAEVREYQVAIQQKTAEKYDMVMDGRDIGTVVLPDAPVKFFMTASVETRAMRRYLQLKDAGIEKDINELETEITARDKNDSERKASPLKQADDAILIDNSHLTEEEVNEIILSKVKEVYGDVI